MRVLHPAKRQTGQAKSPIKTTLPNITARNHSCHSERWKDCWPVNPLSLFNSLITILNLTVRLLEPSTGTTSTILLGLTTTRIGNKKISVISHKSSPQLVLAALIHILGIVGDDALGNGLSNGIDLSGETSSLDSDANVEVGEFVLAEDEDGLEGLETEALGLDVLDGLTVDLDQTAALLGESAGGGCLFPGWGSDEAQKYFVR